MEELGGQIPGSSCFGLLGGGGTGTLEAWLFLSWGRPWFGEWGVGGPEWVDLRAECLWRRVAVGLGWSEGEGRLRKAVVTEGGSWCLANKPWIPSPPSPSAPAVSFLFILWWEVEGALLEMRLFEEDGPPATYLKGWVRPSPEPTPLPRSLPDTQEPP